MTFSKFARMSAQMERRNVIVMAISHVGDLLIFGTDGFVSFLDGKFRKECGAKVFEVCGGGDLFTYVN